MTFYTYIHTRNDTGAVFYVGKGTAALRRAYKKTRSTNPHWTRIVSKHGHTVEIIEHFDDEQDAFAMERYLVASYRALGISLCNLTNGGEGVAGHIHSPEAREKIKTNMGPQELSSAGRAKIVAVNLGNQHAKGYHHTQDAKERIRQAVLAASPETKMKHGNALRGKHRSAETRAKIGAANSGSRGWVMPKEQRSKISASMRAHYEKRRQEANEPTSCGMHGT